MENEIKETKGKGVNFDASVMAMLLDATAMLRANQIVQAAILAELRKTDQIEEQNKTIKLTDELRSELVVQLEGLPDLKYNV